MKFIEVIEDKYKKNEHVLYNFSEFANDMFEVICFKYAKKILDEESFIEEEGLTFEQLFMQDPSTVFFKGEFNGIDFVGIKNINYHYIFANEEIDFSNIPTYENIDSSDKLSWLLSKFKAVNTFEFMGIERTIEEIENNVFKINSDFSTRYVISDGEKNIAGIQVTNDIIENIYVCYNCRRNHLAQKIIEIAKKDFPELQHSDITTELGKKMIKKIKL